MTPERRTAARGHASAKVALTDAAGDKTVEGDLGNVGRGGLFVASSMQLPVGKMVDVEIRTEAGATIAGMGRVIWVRDMAQGDLPAGMGVKFIDVDNEALLAIDRLVGLKKNVRERTILGIAAPTPPAKIEVPKVEASKVDEPRPVAKSRERTMLGIAPPEPREKELSWPDEPPAPPPEPEPAPTEAAPKEPVAAKEPEPTKEEELPTPAKPTEHEPPEPEPAPLKEEPAKPAAPAVAAAVAAPKADEPGPPVPRELPEREHGGGVLKWIVLVVVIACVGAAIYMFRDAIFPGPAASSASSAPVVSASAPTATIAPSAPSAEPSATTAPSAEPTTSASSEPLTVEIVNDAGGAPHDAGHDASDGGRHHHNDGGVHAHGHPHTAPSGATDNPY